MLRSTVALTTKTMKNFKDSEKFIERYLCREVESRGGLALKYSYQGAMGYPDRLCLLPGGRVFWVEVKSKGRKPDILQCIRISVLRDLGQHVYVADSVETIDKILDNEL